MSNTQQTLSSHLEAIANAMPDPIFIMGEDGTYLDVIGGKERSLYADGNSLIGRNYKDVLPEKMAERFLNVVRKAIKSQSLQEIEYQLANEEVRGIDAGDKADAGQWYEARVYPLNEEAYEQPAVIWLAINITERKYMEEKIEHLSKNDALTDFYNRDFFLDLSDERIRQAGLQSQPVSMIKIDLDCFKNVTDAYGPEIGDKAILTAGHALKSAIKDLGEIGRVSCDQFLVFLPEVKGVDAFRIVKLAQEKITGMRIDLGDGNTTCLTSHAAATEMKENETSRDMFARLTQCVAEIKSSEREITKIC